MSDQKLVAIWHRQYVRPRDIGERLYITDERMTKMVNDAYEAGRKDGNIEGRYELRQMIEKGEIEGLGRI